MSGRQSKSDLRRARLEALKEFLADWLMIPIALAVVFYGLLRLVWLLVWS